ncbi:TVP38/TMEM64 family protein [Streptomyces gobiensis]|uniref:TVP38/TMEM64 family protein n=1 Tax=Streptomyces gobiensis TaxID=2875706 RepID=UPI001E5D9EAD|nr:TVP38/TMEM64 family protein [Streptomyces gobiensis]UGY94836.1 TVP38/TMEM64 family protein [Streptomyces gobiensis]
MREPPPDSRRNVTSVGYSPSVPAAATQPLRRRPACARCTGGLLSPWARLSLLIMLLTAAATAFVLYEPQRLLTEQWAVRLSGGAAVVIFAVAYGVCTAAFAPRPVLNLAAGVLFGTPAGTTSALAGTVLGAGIAFGLGRLLGQDALRPLLRGRWLAAGDRQLSQHGFRAVLVLRLVPGVPFAASNYTAAVSRMSWLTFLSATALGSVPNTVAYVVAGSRATAPTSPAFLAAFGFIAITGVVAAVIAWRKRGQLRAAAHPDPTR